MLQRAETSPQNCDFTGFRVLDLEHVQNTKDFALISGRVGDIPWLSTLKHRLPRILHFLFSDFPYDLEISEYIENTAHYTSTPPATWRTKKVLEII